MHYEGVYCIQKFLLNPGPGDVMEGTVQFNHAGCEAHTTWQGITGMMTDADSTDTLIHVERVLPCQSPTASTTIDICTVHGPIRLTTFVFYRVYVLSCGLNG